MSQASRVFLGFGEDGTPQPILTTALLLAEDTYTSEELVDQQPVLLKVMDTADQVRHQGTSGATRPAGPRLDHDWTTAQLLLSPPGWPRELRALPVLGQRLPRCLQHQ